MIKITKQTQKVEYWDLGEGGEGAVINPQHQVIKPSLSEPDMQCKAVIFLPHSPLVLRTPTFLLPLFCHWSAPFLPLHQSFMFHCEIYTFGGRGPFYQQIKQAKHNSEEQEGQGFSHIHFISQGMPCLGACCFESASNSAIHYIYGPVNLPVEVQASTSGRILEYWRVAFFIFQFPNHPFLFSPLQIKR